jgi:hypothetical protein
MMGFVKYDLYSELLRTTLLDIYMTQCTIYFFCKISLGLWDS